MFLSLTISLMLRYSHRDQILGVLLAKHAHAFVKVGRFYYLTKKYYFYGIPNVTAS